jgi:hypothetical protein
MAAASSSREAPLILKAAKFLLEAGRRREKGKFVKNYEVFLSCITQKLGIVTMA